MFQKFICFSNGEQQAIFNSFGSLVRIHLFIKTILKLMKNCSFFRSVVLRSDVTILQRCVIPWQLMELPFPHPHPALPPAALTHPHPALTSCPLITHPHHPALSPAPRQPCLRPAGAVWRLPGKVGKNPGFKKKPAQWICFVFCLGFLRFFGFFVFFCFFWFFYIFAQKREFLGFFSFKNTFRCIQTLNYNHSY